MYMRLGATRTVHNAHGPLAVFKVVACDDLLALVVDAVHPANLGALPPSPELLAYKGVQIGLARSESEFFQEVAVWRRHW